MNIDTTDIFKKSFRKLLKKDRKLIDEYEKLLEDLENNQSLGTELGNGRYKIRLKNNANNKGKSAGYRVVTYTKIKNTIVLIYIYSKSNEESVSTHKIDEIISNYKEEVL
ncbi:MAG: hypothetical protein DRG78_16665 [Epsilonproteobacteria bacterium]|nr:MAG: hypothetical protein DRG78_16665 [Campylobacterota bacterium]